MNLNPKSWWSDAVIYQVYPRSFFDTNGDGEGDIKGITAKLDYLKNLNIDAIWLSPFYKSPLNDGGYDVSDPRDVNSRFGEINDVKDLILKSHEKGLKIIVDIVPNHFSTDHEWFKDALKSEPGSKARERFHFYDGRGNNGDTPPNNWNSIFGGPAWTRVKEKNGADGQWYLNLFDSTQADLNWNNPDVWQDFEKTLRFWFDLGVDGFRIDVAHGLAKDKILVDHSDPKGLTEALRLDVSGIDPVYRNKLLSDIPFFDRPGVHEIYKKWRKVSDSYPGDRMFVAEAWVYPATKAAQYVREDELHQIFNFDFLVADWNDKKLKNAITETLQTLKEVKAPPTWVLCNHDTPRVVARLGGANLGQKKARALALLTHALPGSVYIYQGEELGLDDAKIADQDRQDPIFLRSNGQELGRDACRVPLPWKSNEINYGFSSVEPWIPIPNDWQSEAVDSQEQDSSSHLNFYKKFLAIRRQHPALGGNGEIRFIDTPSGVLGFRREPGFAAIANTSAEAQKINLVGEILVSSSDGVEVKDSYLYIPANTTVWLNT